MGNSADKMFSSPEDGVSTIRLRRLCFLFGFFLSVLMALRSQVSGDQLTELARGWLFLHTGVPFPYGEHMSSGGFEPGSLMSLVTGLPLMVWSDYRSPALFLVITHLIAYLLLDRIVGEVLKERGRLFFCIIYWLNPWRLFFSAFIWNPNFLILVTALHLLCIYRQRNAPSFYYSFLLVVSLGLGAELHASVTVLGVATVILFLRSYFRVRWTGAFSGALFVALTLIPWMREVLHNPSILPHTGARGYLGWALLHVVPCLRGLLYLLRMCSFSAPHRMTAFDFTPLFGSAADVVIWPLSRILWWLLMISTISFAVFAHYRFLRAYHSVLKEKPNRSTGSERWFAGFVLLVFVAAFITFALSPVPIMSWQTTLLLPEAVIPLLYTLLALDSSHPQRTMSSLTTYLIAAVPMLMIIGTATPQYRRGGRESAGLPLRYDHPMLHELNILPNSDIRICLPNCGFWIDVFPDPLPPEEVTNEKACRRCGP